MVRYPTSFTKPPLFVSYLVISIFRSDYSHSSLQINYIAWMRTKSKHVHVIQYKNFIPKPQLLSKKLTPVLFPKPCKLKVKLIVGEGSDGDACRQDYRGICYYVFESASVKSRWTTKDFKTEFDCKLNLSMWGPQIQVKFYWQGRSNLINNNSYMIPLLVTQKWLSQTLFL